jgi:hypothetical protein
MYLQNKYTTWYNNIIATAKSRVLPKDIYTETHHIIPRSLGGNNHSSNLVVLTAKEHRLVHILLPRMTINPNHTKSMWYAAWMILRTKNKDQVRKISKGKAYELAKIKIAEFSSQLHKGKTVSPETRAKQSAKAKGRVSPNKDKPMPEEQKQKLSIAHKGKSIAPETVAKILETRKNYKHSEETKQKISAGNKGKQVIISEEQKQKISNSLKGRPNTNKGRPAFNLGVPHSAETKEKIRLAATTRSKVLCCYCNKNIVPSMYARWHGDKCKMKSF